MNLKREANSIFLHQVRARKNKEYVNLVYLVIQNKMVYANYSTKSKRVKMNKHHVNMELNVMELQMVNA